jgi:molybdate transport system substrate-binding protein
MKKRLIGFTAALLATFVLVVGIGKVLERPLAAQTTPLQVFAAISLTESLNDIKTVSGNPAPTANYTLDSSGRLQQLIQQGQYADVFMSAAPTQMDTLQSQGLIVASTRCNLLTNRLAVIQPKTSTLVLNTINDLATNPLVRTIAIGNPTTVPAGQYAVQLFQNLGIYNAVQPKLRSTYTNVRAVLSAVQNKQVDVGIVYTTDAAIATSTTKIATSVPSSAQPPIIYPVAVVTASTNQTTAKAWLKFLYSSGAQSKFTARGFGIAGPICPGLQ